MSDVKRLPDSDGWWWRRGEKNPLRVRIYHGRAQRQYQPYGSGWHELTPGEYLPCPAPDWPPEPPPRPKMVYAMTTIPRDRKIGPCWWVRVDFGWRQLHYDLIRAYHELIPHNHPEQSAEESRRILAEACQT